MVLLMQRPRRHRRGTPGRYPVKGVFVKRFLEATGNRPIAVSELHRWLRRLVKGQYPRNLPRELQELAGELQFATKGHPPNWHSFYVTITQLRLLGWIERVGTAPRSPERQRKRLLGVSHHTLIRLSPQGLATPLEDWSDVNKVYLAMVAQRGPIAPGPPPEQQWAKRALEALNEAEQAARQGDSNRALQLVATLRSLVSEGVSLGGDAAQAARSLEAFVVELEGQLEEWEEEQDNLTTSLARALQNARRALSPLSPSLE